MNWVNPIYSKYALSMGMHLVILIQTPEIALEDGFR